MAVVGLESTPDFPTISTDRPQSGAQSGAPRAPSGNLADADGAPGTIGIAADDPLLARLLNAYASISHEDRLRVTHEAERLADAAGAILDTERRG
jgi:hypothetical protein